MRADYPGHVSHCPVGSKQRTGVLGALVSVLDVFGIGMVYLLHLVHLRSIYFWYMHRRKLIDFVNKNSELTLKRQSTFVFSMRLTRINYHLNS